MSIKFNPEGKDRLTHGECLDPAMRITDQAEADQYLADYVAYIQKSIEKEPRSDGITAAQIASMNLGHYAGYGDHSQRLRVEKLFRFSHPVFGGAK